MQNWICSCSAPAFAFICRTSSTPPQFGRVQLVFGQQAVQRAPVDAAVLGGARDIAAVFGQYGGDVALFKILDEAFLGLLETGRGDDTGPVADDGGHDVANIGVVLDVENAWNVGMTEANGPPDAIQQVNLIDRFLELGCALLNKMCLLKLL